MSQQPALLSPAGLAAAYEELAQAYIAIVNNEAGAVERYQVASDRLKALRGDP